LTGTGVRIARRVMGIATRMLFIAALYLKDLRTHLSAFLVLHPYRMIPGRLLMRSIIDPTPIH
jgi:hypothetical protein